MSTLLLRLAAPMQAWGDESKYDIRGTRKEPTKSGVIGLIAAAMGYKRDSEEIVVLDEKLRMGIRVDQQGRIEKDFHIARAPKYDKNGFVQYEEDGSIKLGDSYVTYRYYLCDAVFLVGLESDDASLLQEVKEALTHPVYPLFLGRRSCPITQPFVLGVEQDSLEAVLKNYRWIASDWYQKKYGSTNARMIFETAHGQQAWYTLRDKPISFSPIHRKHGIRGVDKEQNMTLGVKEHDPMSVL
ncbi:MAG: type I-E CRISPR-associated protein Cas5/CasD [Bacillota bacterium]|nr:type I-E CRISPR-associated protein Cas5/CasD [Bacillota bacterium]